MQKNYDKTDDWLRAIQSIGQLIAEVLMEQDGGEKCNFELSNQFFSDRIDLVKASSGPRYVVGCKPTLNKKKLKVGARVTLDLSTLTIMRVSSYFQV
jgi:26S proteasome regulatory subunit T4